jgi:hypothetical protein
LNRVRLCLKPRRHSEVLIDSVRDDLRIAAEGLVALGTKIDALRQDRRQ